MIEILIMIVFWGLVILYTLARLGGLYGRPRSDVEVSKGEKLFQSKAYDAAFFDGESEDYAETMARLRQYGGA
ncbi:MAG: hypothetical protein JW779_13020 [Candidatus Thorarchaeota archaeon]|nr:hypothetical protein [Candidatus Thorarchaeota archaeon]